jgi:hypothetical protein
MNYKIKAAKNWRLALQKGMDSVCSKDILNVLAKVFVNIDWDNRNRITFCGWFLEGTGFGRGYSFKTDSAPAE